MNRDLVEEAIAGSAIVTYLAGKPIKGTSGDSEHVLSPIKVEFSPPKATKSGSELAITITHTDRHHPELVYDTIKEHLARMDELKGYPLKAFDQENDVKKENSEITVRYDLPSGVADSIILALSKRGKSEGNVGAALSNLEKGSSGSWVDRAKEMKDKVLSYVGM